MARSYDLLVLSHLRWDFVFQRPQHLLSRFARAQRVLFFEEPVPLPEGELESRLDLSPREDGLTVAVPRLPAGVTGLAADEIERVLLDRQLAVTGLRRFVVWYYTPMALGFTRHLAPLATVYDCMDELSSFRGAPPEMLLREAELLQRADLVFTGGQSLYEAKRRHHRSVHAFPSSVDVAHFRRARLAHADPDDQVDIPGPRLGFCGVLDERLDTHLVARVAEQRPDWHFVMLGPVAKIDPAELPRLPNVHYLGLKPYAELPAYLAGWDVAMLPFARNEATRFISPTKTPEYLAAGKAVVSTSIRDVVRPYGEQGLVHIADTPDAFVAAVEEALREDPASYLERVDAFLADVSWDSTWSNMARLVQAAIETRECTVRWGRPEVASGAQPVEVGAA
ncbi:MAG TPA: glycosyltransferase family 1 protein [Chloroflexota bacterium]|nr:glycosyltransferase family 1 protein [Chloroflexota bacterium]